MKVNITSGNSSFFFPGSPVKYEVAVSDKEDGSLENKRITTSQVSVTADYLSEGYNLTVIAQKQVSADAFARYAGAMNLINKSDCRSCHAVKEKVLGPSFLAVAQKYKGDQTAPSKLAKKNLSGGSGVWGDAFMPAHPTMAESDVKAITNYILSLANPPARTKSLPVRGTYTPKVPQGENKDGSFILRAAYTDRGAKASAAQSAEDIFVLYSPAVPVFKASQVTDIMYNRDSTVAITKATGSTLKFSKIDLTNIRQVEIAWIAGRNAATGEGTVAIYSGSPQGKLLGKYAGAYTSQKNIQIDMIEPAPGITDLYVVFSGTSLRLTHIKFIPTD